MKSNLTSSSSFGRKKGAIRHEVGYIIALKSIYRPSYYLLGVRTWRIRTSMD